jgi:metal-sulfur cluster biosynthetic enzyme
VDDATVGDGSGTVNTLTETDVRRIINDIKDPCTAARGVPIGLDDLGLVRQVEVTDRGDTGPSVALVLGVTSPSCLFFLDFERLIRTSLGEAGAAQIDVQWDSTFGWSPSDIAQKDQRRLGALRLELAARYQ